MLAVKSTVLCSSLQKLLPASSVLASIRPISDDVSFIRDINPASFARGPGGRSSFSGKVVTIFGATGFLGSYTASHLAKIGTQIVIPFREYFMAKRLKLMGDLGQLVFTEFSLQDDDSLRRAMMYSDTVINLISQQHCQFHDLTEQVNIEGARKIARIAKEMGVPHLIHVSALNSNIPHEGFWKKGGSWFLDTKGRGEIAVKEEFPNATIFRPSDMFGDGDLFFMSMLNRFRVGLYYNVPFPNKGKGIYKQPIHVINVAQAITYATMNGSATAGMTYEAIGPRRYEFCNLIDYLHRIIRRDPLFNYNVSDAKYDAWLYLKMSLSEKGIIDLYDRAAFGRDRIEREAVTDTTSGLPTLGDMTDLRLTTIEEIAEMTVKIFQLGRAHSQSIPQAFVEPITTFEEVKC